MTTDAEIRSAMSIPYERPVRVVPAGAWTVWACGHASVAVRATPLMMSPDEGPIVSGEGVTELVALIESPRATAVSASALAAWCKGHCRSECSRCGGAGKTALACPHDGCDHAHVTACGRCGGSGVVDAMSESQRPVRIEGVMPDARIVSSLLSLFGDAEVTISGATFRSANTNVLVFGNEQIVAALAGTTHEQALATWGSAAT